MDRGAWRATVHGVTESDTTERQSSQSRPCARGRGSLPDLEGASPWHTLTCSLLSSPGPWRIMVTFSLPYPLQGQDKRKQALLQQKMLGICLQRRRSRFDSWVGKIPWRRKCQPTPVSLPGKSHGQRSLVGCNPWSHKGSGTIEQLTLTYLCMCLSCSYLCPNHNISKEQPSSSTSNPIYLQPSSFYCFCSNLHFLLYYLLLLLTPLAT